MASVLTGEGYRDTGLTVNELDILRHCREYFALPPTSERTAIVGVLLVVGQQAIRLMSGRQGGPYGGTQRGGFGRGTGSGFNRFTLTHVEGHAAATMKVRNISRATLLIELPPCGSCDPLLPRMLPVGARLEVVYPEDTTYYWSCQRV